jgi:molecular chaperone DnaJ
MSTTHEYLDKDLYAVLGLSKGASAGEIKKAYRKLARELHPDQNKNNPEAEARFKQVSEAYSVLGNESRRKEYDEARELFATAGSNPGFNAGFSARRPGPGAEGVQFDFGDIFGAQDGELGDLLGGIFTRSSRGSTSGARRGRDVETEISIDFTAAVEGTTVPLRLSTEQPCASCAGTGAKAGSTPRTCPSCTGTGQATRNMGGFAVAEPCRNCRGRGLIIDDPCPTCSGSGRTQRTRTVKARIAPGALDGQRIRLKGKGEAGARGGPAGDLYVTVHVRPHPVFGRKGDHLTLTVPVTFPEAALGAQITVPTLDGTPVTVRLPAGTPSGRTLRVRGKGVRRPDGTRGDLLVTVTVAVPASLSPEARDALAAYAAATADEDPRATLLGPGTGTAPEEQRAA